MSTRTRQRKTEKRLAFYNAVTDPMLPSITAPIPITALPHKPWIYRVVRGIGYFLAFIVQIVNQLLALALVMLLLLLLTRFILYVVGIPATSVASDGNPFLYWVFLLSTPLVEPLRGLVPPLVFHGYSIDVATLLTMVASTMVVTLLRLFLKLFLPRSGM